ncbi:MAG: ubiquinol oxidase subunit II [gamma proteobacterium endosymbiont of Trioza apicalis]
MIFKKFDKILKFCSLLIIPILLSGYSEIILMNPKGQIGLQQRSLILTSLGLMLIIVIPVIIMVILFTIKYNESNIKSKYKPNWSHSNKLEFIIWFIPILIISILAFITFKSTYELDPNKSIISNNKPIIIEVIALNWKWLFIYPKENIATINEVVFPVNIPIEFRITSDSVMNSFFIPQLGSQIYAMNGMQSKLNLIANTPGLYKGISSNFSGQGFSDMKFNVIVTINKFKYNEWIDKVKNSPNKIITNDDYQKIYKSSINNKINYFSKIKLNLFNDIIDKFICKKK